jgi:hypothetical protein
MTKAVYDTNSDSIVDNSLRLNGELASHYLNAANLTGEIGDAAIPATIARVADIPTNTDGLAEGSTNKYFSAVDKSKLDAIAANADVTNSTNVGNAGAVMDSDFSTDIGFMKRTGTGAYTVIPDNSANWQTAFGWGDHSGEGYLTSTNWAAPNHIGSSTPNDGSFTSLDSEMIVLHENSVANTTTSPCTGKADGTLLQSEEYQSLYRCLNQIPELVSTRYHHVFVTNGTFMPGTGPFSSVTDADIICQNEARAASLAADAGGGPKNAWSYKAILGSTMGENGARMELGHPENRLKLVAPIYSGDIAAPMSSMILVSMP